MTLSGGMLTKPFSIHAFIERHGKTKQMPMVFNALIGKLGQHCAEGFLAVYEKGLFKLRVYST